MELEKICQSDYQGSGSSEKWEIDISAKASFMKEVEEDLSLEGWARTSERREQHEQNRRSKVQNIVGEGQREAHRAWAARRR